MVIVVVTFADTLPCILRGGCLRPHFRRNSLQRVAEERCSSRGMDPGKKDRVNRCSATYHQTLQEVTRQCDSIYEATGQRSRYRTAQPLEQRGGMPCMHSDTSYAVSPSRFL